MAGGRVYTCNEPDRRVVHRCIAVGTCRSQTSEFKCSFVRAVWGTPYRYASRLAPRDRPNRTRISGPDSLDCRSGFGVLSFKRAQTRTAMWRVQRAPIIDLQLVFSAGRVVAYASIRRW